MFVEETNFKGLVESIEYTAMIRRCKRKLRNKNIVSRKVSKPNFRKSNIKQIIIINLFVANLFLKP